MTLKKQNSLLPHIDGSHCMTWRELVEADDLATSLVVDPFLGFKTHKMTDMRMRLSDRVKGRLKNIIFDFQKDKDYEKAYTDLLGNDVNIKRSLKADGRFRMHIYRYLLLFDDRSGVQIRPCWRYASESHIGAAIFATKDWPKGSRIESLVGCIAELNYEEEVSFLRHKQNDFSVMYSSRKNRSQLWLGPAAYVNHDCQPNCAFTINCDGDARMSLNVLQNIKKGDEIYIYYGKHFFDSNNASCECFTCELLGRGFFVPSVSPSSRGSTATTLTACNSMTDLVDAANPASSHSSQHGDEVVELLRERLMQAPPNGITSAVINSSENAVAISNSIPGTEMPGTEPTEASMNGLLVKGLSAGLGHKALSAGQYTLRHTDTRMRRVKDKIFAEMLSLAQRRQSAPAIAHPPAPLAVPATRMPATSVKTNHSPPPPPPPPPSSHTSTQLLPPSQLPRKLGNCQNTATMATTPRYSLRARTPPNNNTGTKVKLVRKRLSSSRSHRAAGGATRRRTDLGVKETTEAASAAASPLLVDLTASPELLPGNADVNFFLWNSSLDQCRSPSSSSSSTSSTIAATYTEPQLPLHLPLSPSYSLRSHTIATPLTVVTKSDGGACVSAPSSTASTLPATWTSLTSLSATPRLRLVCKRSRTESSLGDTEAMTADEDEWYVDGGDPPPPPLCLSSVSASFIACCEASVAAPTRNLSFLLQQQRRNFGSGTSLSNTSASNTPSPPRLQASGSPLPPILHQPEDRFLDTCLQETAPALGQVDEERGAGDECLKPLTVKIRRLGKELYCVSSEASEDPGEDSLSGC